MPGIYIHIPFCKAKCRYCDFVSFADHTDMGGYLDALAHETAICAEALPKLHYDTVFIGGGTPSILPGGAIADILERVFKHYRVAEDAEITMESNPGTLSREKLCEYKKAGVNRLSMGLQSADAQVLRNIGRIHDYAQFEESFRLAREAGFTNINADIMYGLPEQSVTAHIDTIERLASLGVEHISSYSLILEETTPLYMDVNGGAQSLPDEDTVYDMDVRGRAKLEALGYRRYEISNYARPGYESRHNINYWDNGEYLGLGLNSHSAMRLDGAWTRWSNTSDMCGYLQALALDERPLAAEPQQIPLGEEMFECMMLGLRKTAGISDAAFTARFGKSVRGVFPQALARLEAKGMLLEEAGMFRLTDKGLDLQNLALLELM